MKVGLFLLAVSLIGMISNYVNAQDKFGSGYYVKVTGDTVKGFIDYQKNYGSSIAFRNDQKSRSVNLSYEEVTQFGFINGLKFGTLNFGAEEFLAKPVFANLLLEGSIDLYKYRGRFFVDAGDKNRFMLALGKKRADKEALKNYQTNTGYFNIIFNDCPSVQNKAPQTPIRSKELVQLLKEFHNCINEPYEERQMTKRKATNFGLYIGNSITNISFSSNDDPELRYLESLKFKSSNLIFGITILRSKNPSSSIGWQHEFALKRASFEQYSYNQFYDYTPFAEYRIVQTTLTAINYSALIYRTGPRFSLRSNSLNPYTSFGITLPLWRTLNNSSIKTRQVNGGQIESVEIEPPLRLPGVWASVGIKKKIFKHHFLFIEQDFDVISRNRNGRFYSTSTKIGFLF